MKKTAFVLALIPLLASNSMAVVYTFGTDNDVLGGFTQSTPIDTNEIWTTQPGSVQYRNQDGGTRNSSFLQSVSLDRSAGKAYRIQGVVTMTDGYADDNNRVGMYLFGDSPEVADQLETGAIGLMFNTDDGAGGSPDDNADDSIYLAVGIDNGNLEPAVLRTQNPTPFAQDLFGTTVTFTSDIAFVGTDIVIQAALREADGTETTTSVTVTAADYTGDYFGFVTRARARNYATDPTPEGRGSPWVMDYQSFSVTEIPEPGTLTLVAAMGGLLLGRRRRPRR